MRITPHPSRRDLIKSSFALAAGQFCVNLAGARIAGAEALVDARTTPAWPTGSLPARTDIVMSIRSFRPDGLQRLRDFHATRCEWIYSNDAAYVAEMKKIVHHVGLAISPAKRIPNDAGAANDIDGSKAVAPWMRVPGNNTPWNSLFKEAARTSILNTVKDSVAIGADSIQCDDPAMEFAIVQWGGGDFSPEALAAFQAYCKSSPDACGDLANDNFDMSSWVKRRAGQTTSIDWKAFKQAHGTEPAWQAWRAFLKGTTSQFLGSIRQYLHSLQRPLPLSINVNNPIPVPDLTFLLDAADYLISEINGLQFPRQLVAHHACTAAWQLPFVPSIVPVSTPDTQWGIALGYALGDNPLVPWDVYVPNKDRYYGTVEDFGYLFDFVRANAQYFDGFSEIGDVALVIDERTAENQTTYVPGMRSLDMGATYRLVVLRADGTVTGDHATAFQPQIAVAVNCPTSSAQRLFPSIPILALSDYKANGSSSALRRMLRTVTPDPQRIVAIPRINKSNGTLLVHVVDATKSNQGFMDHQFLDVIVPQPYWSYVKGVQNATLIRPRADSLKQPVAVKQDRDSITMRVPLAGIFGWGLLVFERNAG